MNTAATVIGLGAGTLTTLAFIPQVARIWRTRSARDISLPTFAALALGTTLWLAYGILLDDVPLMAANGVTLGLIAAVLWGKLTFK